MYSRNAKRFSGLFAALTLLLQTAQAEMVPMAASDAQATATEENTNTPVANPSDVSETVSATRPVTSQIMGGITLSKSPMTIDFQEADVRDVIHLLAVKSGLNIIYGADVTGPVTVHLDRVPFDQAFQTILTLKGLVALPLGQKVIRVVTSTGLTTEQSQAATFTRVFRLNYASADDIKKPVDAIRTAAGRKGVSTVDVKTNSLIVTDTQEGLKEVEDLIPVLDKKPQQVDIEAKVVEVDLTNNLNTGISWQYAGSTGSNDAYKIGSTNATTGNNAAGGSAAVGATVLSPNPPASATNPGGTGVALNNITADAFSFLTAQGTYILAAQVAALLDQNKAKVLSTPHIVTTNNEEASINVADQIPYQTTTVSNGVSQESVQFISAGVKLSVKPTVNADHRITMHVRPEVSNPSGSALPNLPPTVNNRNAETTVILRDGETIAIGGLITESTSKAVSGIPLLMDIPVLGYLFKSISDSKTRTELIIFMTPRITRNSLTRLGDHTAPSPELPDFFVGGLLVLLTVALLFGGAIDLWVQTLLHVGILGLAAGILLVRPNSLRPTGDLRKLFFFAALFFFFLIASTSLSGALDRSQQVLRNWVNVFVLFWIVIQFSPRQKGILLTFLYIPWTCLLLWAFRDCLLKHHPQASLLNPNFLAGVLIFPFFLSLAHIRMGSKPVELYALWAFVCAIVLLLTASTGAWLAITIAVAYATFSYTQKRSRRLSIGTMTALALFAGLLALKLHSGWDQNRWSWWKACGEMAAAHPLFGNGPGSFEIGLPHWAPMTLYTSYAHNTWLQWFSENGIFAMCALGLFIFQCLQRQQNRWLMAAAIGVMIHNLIDSDLVMPVQSLMFWLWLALPLQATVEKRTTRTLRSLACLATLAFAIISLQRFRADQSYAAATTLDPRQDALAIQERLHDAMQIAPMSPDTFALSAQTLLASQTQAITRGTLQLTLAYERQAIARERLQAQFLADAIRMCNLLGLPEQGRALTTDSFSLYPFLNHDKRIQNSLAS